MLLHGKRVCPVILNMNSMVGEILLLLTFSTYSMLYAKILCSHVSELKQFVEAS